MFLNVLDVARILYQRFTATEIPTSEAREGSLLIFLLAVDFYHY